MADDLIQPKLTDRQHNWQKSLSNTGRNTELLGWLIIALAPILLFVQSSPNPIGLAAIWIVGVLCGLYYIWSGRYIQYKHGKYTSTLLLANGLVTIVLASGLLPLFVLVESWVTYIRYHKDNKKLKTEPFGATHASYSVANKVLLGIFIAVGVGSVIYFSSNPSITTSTGSATEQSPQFQPYTSAEDNFVVNFPGIPSVTSNTSPVNGIDVPQTSYERDISNGNIIYSVDVTKYPSTFQFSDVKGALQGAANGEVQNTQGAKMVSTSFITFLGGDALDSEYTFPNSGVIYTAYSRNFMKGNVLYTVFTFGETQANFNNFANSFNFTQ
jgi:hypothetical protein